MIILLGCANDNLEDMLISNIYCTTVDLQVTVNDFSTPNCTTEGSIMVAASGGIEPYSYSIDGETFSTNPVFSGLSGGDFVLIAMDSQGCIAEVDYTLEASENTVSLNIENSPSDCLNDTGTITVTASGGDGNYSYKIGSNPFQTSNSFSNIGSGNHLVSVSDGEGCEATRSVFIANSTSLETDIMPIIQANCALSGCHISARSPTLNSKIQVISNANAIKSATESRSMPIGRSLTQDQIDLISCWVEAGAKDN